MFSEEGRSNDFRQLRSRLYVGATDQDSREHVLFGDEGFDDVPISKAVQASIAWHPFFPSVEIRGRYYTDGVVTRTVNLTAAIEKGADLVFVLDPFVPLVTDEPGANARKGNMWILEQDLKTMSYTRFEQAREELQRRQSHASVYTFVPSNRMRRLMSSQNPLVSRNFDAIVCEAYRSTRRRLSQLEYRIRGDLLAHGIKLDLAPAMEKVERMRAAREPSVLLLLDELPGGRHGHRVA
jgi:predicted acylesterase/phospholipase RssA